MQQRLFPKPKRIVQATHASAKAKSPKRRRAGDAERDLALHRHRELDREAELACSRDRA